MRERKVYSKLAKEGNGAGKSADKQQFYNETTASEVFNNLNRKPKWEVFNRMTLPLIFKRTNFLHALHKK